MTLRTRAIDEQGRLFGRFNLIDAALAVVAVILIPAAYAAYLLFRSPAVTIASVEPVALSFIEERAAAGTRIAGKLKVRGTGFRPVFRATIGDQQTIAFIFEQPTSADVLFGDLAPGTHDLVLYDGVQEVARTKGIVTIRPVVTSQARVRLVGTFIDLDEPDARSLAVGKSQAAGPPAAEIAALGEPAHDQRSIRMAGGGRVLLAAEGRWQRPASLILNCDLTPPLECHVGGQSVAEPSAVIVIPGSRGSLKFIVDGLVPAEAPVPASVRVRFAAEMAVAEIVKAGDVDIALPPLDDRAARIASVGGKQIITGEVSVGTAVDRSTESPFPVMRVSGKLASFEAVLLAGLDRSPAGWRYRSRLVTPGGSITFDGPGYTIHGVVTGVAIRPPSGAQDR